MTAKGLLVDISIYAHAPYCWYGYGETCVPFANRKFKICVSNVVCHNDLIICSCRFVLRAICVALPHRDSKPISPLCSFVRLLSFFFHVPRRNKSIQQTNTKPYLFYTQRKHYYKMINIFERVEHEGKKRKHCRNALNKKRVRRRE